MTDATATDAHLALALRRVLAACWTRPEAFKVQVANLAAIVAQRQASALEEATP